MVGDDFLAYIYVELFTYEFAYDKYADESGSNFPLFDVPRYDTTLTLFFLNVSYIFFTLYVCSYVILIYFNCL